jgi:NADH-quinone oxidoreductase subunit J
MNQATELVANGAPSIFMWVASFFAILFALIVFISRNPISCAVALMGTLFSTAALYFSLGNFFVGAIQILVYAGAIAVLFVFIVMLLDLRPQKLKNLPGQMPFFIFSGIVAALLAFFLFKTIHLIPKTEGSTASHLTATQYAQYFLSQYQAAFQAAGLLVFGAILGAIVLARGHLGKKENS